MNDKDKDSIIKHIKTSDFTTNTVLSLDEIKNQLNSRYGVAGVINDLISEHSVRPGSIIDSRILIVAMSDFDLNFFDLRSYKLYIMTYDCFEDFVKYEDINIHNYIDIRDRLFNNANYNNDINKMACEFKNMFDDRMKAVVEVVCEEAAKKFTENFIDDMLMIRDREEDY